MTNTVVRRKGRGSEVSLTIAYSFRAVNSGVVGRPTCDFRSHMYAQGKRENTTRAIKSETWVFHAVTRERGAGRDIELHTRLDQVSHGRYIRAGLVEHSGWW